MNPGVRRHGWPQERFDEQLSSISAHIVVGIAIAVAAPIGEGSTLESVIFDVGEVLVVARVRATMSALGDASKNHQPLLSGKPVRQTFGAKRR